MNDLLPIGKAAQRLGLSVDTVRELERTGRLKAVRTPGGHRRFKLAVLDAYLTGRSSPRGARLAQPVTPLPRRQAPARRRTRQRPLAKVLLDESEDESWDEADALDHEPDDPLTESLKPPYEQPAERARTSTDRFAEELRLSGLKSHGRSLIPYGASAAARYAVIEAVEAYVTAARFPASMSIWEAREAIEAKVGAILEPYKATAARRPSGRSRRLPDS